VRDATDETVGVARLARNDDTGVEEFAVIVEPDVKGKGLGTHLMRRLIDWARQHKIEEIRGEILAENTNMLTFARHLGFALRYLPSDPEIVEARLVLRPTDDRA
jgi:acetyltransferase